MREANRQLKAESSNQNGTFNKFKSSSSGRKRLVESKDNNVISMDEMELELDDLRSQLEGRDDEVKVRKVTVAFLKRHYKIRGECA